MLPRCGHRCISDPDRGLALSLTWRLPAPRQCLRQLPAAATVQRFAIDERGYEGLVVTLRKCIAVAPLHRLKALIAAGSAS